MMRFLRRRRTILRPEDYRVVVCDKCGRSTLARYGLMLPSEWLRFEDKDGNMRTFCARCVQTGFVRVRYNQ